MKINFSQTIKNLNNKDIEDNEGVLTLARIATNALLANDKVEGTEKMKRFTLATKIHEGGVQDLKPEEVTKIKELVGEGFPPLIVGRAYEILDR